MDALVILIPLLPLLAAATIAAGSWLGLLNGKNGAVVASDLAVWSVTLAFFMALALLVGGELGKTQGFFSVGQWLASDTLDIRVNFASSGFQVALAALFALLLAVIGKSAGKRLQTEAGYRRFLFLFSLFAAAFLFMLLSANMVGCLLGWTLSGWCASGLVGHARQQPAATASALRVLIANRMGDTGFIIGIALSYAWLQEVNWRGFAHAAAELSIGQATGISLCFALAACAKAAQLPFTPWLDKALAAPAPADAVVYGAVMGHAGVFLLCLLQPVFSQSPFALVSLGLVGAASAAYCQLARLSLTDCKSALAYASCAQISLMLVECSLGFWQLARWHLCAHALVRCLQFLNPPWFPAALPSNRPGTAPAWLVMASQQRFWLEPITDWTLFKPIRGLANDLSYFDTLFVDRLLGLPSLSMEHWPQMAEQPRGIKTKLKGAGVAGKLTDWTAAVMHWLESRSLPRGLSQQGSHYGRKLGRLANKLEQVILRPRYLLLFICATFLMAF